MTADAGIQNGSRPASLDPRFRGGDNG
jgi:hypothetical protein